MARTRGFTLIELLVVIAIIAILAAILFPVFARAREKARQTSCLSNVKQMVLGVLMYVQDYDEKLPGSWSSNNMPMWSATIQPYVKNSQLFTCPSSERYSGWGSWDWPGVPNTYYGWNCDASGKALCNRSISIAHFQQPATLILLGDIWNSDWGGGRGDGRLNPVGGASCWGGTRCSIQSNGLAMWPQWHNDGGNMGHLDGHAKWYKPAQIIPADPSDATRDQYWIN